MTAARMGKTDIVVELVKGGADIDMQNKVCCLFLHLTLYETSLDSEYQVYRLSGPLVHDLCRSLNCGGYV